MVLPDAKELEEGYRRKLQRARMLMLTSLFWSVLFIVFLVVIGGRLDRLGADICIKGKVVDENGDPLVRANVTVTGTGHTAMNQTDGEGFYHISDVDSGDTVIRINRTGLITEVYRITTYNVFNEPGRTYELNFQLENGTGVKESGTYSSVRLGNYCVCFTIFFSICVILQFVGLLALGRGKRREAKILSMFGIMSFGFGLSAFLSGFAIINLHKADVDARICERIKQMKKMEDE